jgi:predicted RNase H-like HicB family nuclease
MKIKPELIHPRKEVMGYPMKELIFEVTQEADGGYVAECLTEPIVTQGDDWASMRSAVDEAVRGYFFDAPGSAPNRIRLHLVRDESFAFA